MRSRHHVGGLIVQINASNGILAVSKVSDRQHHSIFKEGSKSKVL